MSVDYSVYFDSKEPIDQVMARLEKMIGAPFKFNENFELWDMYRVEVLGLGLQLSDWRELPKFYEGQESRFTYILSVEYVRAITGLQEGKNWVRTSVVEIARMISRNLNCFSAVMAQDVITHRFDEGTEDNSKQIPEAETC